MKAHIQEKLTEIVSNLKQENLLDTNANVKIMVENTKDKSHGDYATNLAMLLAKPLKKKPLEIAQIIVEKLSSDDKIDRTEIAGPGFINFFIKGQYIKSKN